MTYHDNFDHLVELVLARFLLCKIIFPFLYCILEEQVSMCSVHLRGGYLSFISLRWVYLHTLFEILLHERRILHLSIYSIIYLHPYKFKDVYFML